MAAAENETQQAPAVSPAEGSAPTDADQQPTADEPLHTLTITLPHTSEKLTIMIYAHEQASEVRQSIIESPLALQYSCFHLEYKGHRINDFSPIADIPNLTREAEFSVVEDPYTEKEARLHVMRIRDLIGAAGDRPDVVHGILPGLSLFDSVTAEATAAAEAAEAAGAEATAFDFAAPADQACLLPRTASADDTTAPRTLKALQISPWNPPPAHLRQKGHLLYLIVTTNEGEQFQVTAHVGGFFVSKSSNTKFDPFPRPAPKAHAAHSLLTLIDDLSPSFAASFTRLQEHNSRRDPLASFQITNALPAAPWLVPAPAAPACTHSADITRTQEVFLMAGTDNVDNLRDWNEELQSARELPHETVQDRIFRERLVSKVFADYVDAATRGALLVACGEVAPLNPTEGRDAEIFVYNNIFFSFGADGVGTFTSEGGDEAARVATGKDVAGVRRVNQLDLDGIFSPGTVVIDYLGKRIVGQSLVPGIFKQREPGENQIDYGAVDGKDVVAADERFVEPFAKMSQALNVQRHAVWDKDGKRFELEGSVETKGLMGTDGRKYVLDLYRITPIDIAWQEADPAKDGGDAAYPHRMTVLRPELVDIYSRFKLREWLDGELAKRSKAKEGEEAKIEEKLENEAKEGEEAKKIKEDEAEEKTGDETEEAKAKTKDGAIKTTDADKDRIDVSNFKFALNPDVFSGQVPQTDEEKAQMEADEKEVRAVCKYLHDITIPLLISDLTECDISFPMDGRSLSTLLHKRGINMRYLGRLATLCNGQQPLQCFYDVVVREMITRAFKHIAATYLRYLPLPLSGACLAHLLNCLLGASLNAHPTADVDPMLRDIYSNSDLSFEQVTPESLQAAVASEVSRRFRFTLAASWHAELKGHLQLLREVCLKLGLQILSKNYVFTAEAVDEGHRIGTTEAIANGDGHANGSSSSHKKKKKKAARDGSPSSSDAEARATAVAKAALRPAHTFTPDDIVNVVPVVKDSTPRSALAEEALEAGRISLSQNQKKIGQELLLESLSLHEQIYGILHPEVARAYHSLSMLYYQMDEKEAAVELARKAIVVSERVLGVDSQETLLDYLNLALFLHHQGQSGLALAYTKHALRVWRVLYGPDHPDVITTVNNAAVMLQSTKAYHESRRWFEESLRVSEKVFGRQSLNSATLLFQLAQALAMDQDSKGAVHRMRESYNIFLTELGPEDKNTKDAESWLEQLTQNAVSIAKQAKDLETRRLRAGIRFTTRAATTTTTKAATTAAVGGTRATSAVPGKANGDGGKPTMDSRSIDELLRFIEGTDGKKAGGKAPAGGSSAKKRNGGGAHPKPRGATATA